MFNRIVAATDGSETASKAIAAAADLARRHNADLSLVYVASASHVSDDDISLAEAEHLLPENAVRPAVPVTPMAAAPGVVVPVATVEPVTGVPGEARRAAAARAIGERVLEEAMMTAREAGATRVDTALEFGDDVAEKIMGVARRNGADTVVVGSHGKGGCAACSWAASRRRSSANARPYVSW